MRIEPAATCTPEQLRPVAGQLVLTFGHVYPGWGVDQAVAELANPTGLPYSVVALDGMGGVMGCASLLAEDEVQGCTDITPWLGNVWVDPSRRRTGLGELLVQAIIEHARGLGHTELHLVTENAEQWYAQRGWRSQRRALVHDRAMLLMRLSLGA